MITKQIAATLYGNNYELVDKEGNKYGIDYPKGYGFMSVGYLKITYIKWDKIGIDYFILARPLSDLTKNIEGVGVPLRILKTGGTNRNEFSIRKDDFLGNVYSICDNEEHELRYTDLFGFQRRYRCELRDLNQQPLNEWLDVNHFLRGVDESLIKYIE